MELIKGEYQCSTSESSLMCTALIVCHIIYQYHIIVIGNAQHKISSNVTCLPCHDETCSDCVALQGHRQLFRSGGGGLASRIEFAACDKSEFGHF